MPKVVIDARSLSDASSFRGIGTYVGHLLAGLATEPDLDVVALAHPGVSLPPGIGVRVVRRLAPGRWADREHDLLLPFDLARAGGDLVHSPAQDPPRRCRPPWVQTLHGVVPLAVAHPGLATERARWAARAPRLARAAAFIAVSRHCARQAGAALGLDPALVHVIPHGVGPAFSPISPIGPGARAEGPPYLLYVGEVGPTKGYVEAFEVVGRLAEAGYPHHLRVAGRIAPWVRDLVVGLVASSPRPDRIDLLGHVEHTRKLADLYRGAAALILTSRWESFGLPAVEAMACGTPVVAFDNTALPEVIGSGGLLVPDGDVAAFTAAVRSVLDSPSHQAELAARGRERALAFDWKRCAGAHAEVYRSVLA